MEFISMAKLLFTLFCTILLCSFVAEAKEENLQYHGFVAMGLIDVDGSDFVNDDGSLSTELSEFGFNASYRLNSKVRLAGQVVYLNGGNRYAEGVRVDYALIDWSAYDSPNWRANLYFGRFKNNHWLYSSSRNVPFARSSIILPQSLYFDGFRDIAAGADGVALKISHNNDNYGNFDFNFSYGSSPISGKQNDILLSEFSKGKATQKFETQISFYWQPSFSMWRFGASYLDSDFNYKADLESDRFFNGLFSFQLVTLNALFEGENWELSGEIYQQQFLTDGFYYPQYQKKPIGNGMYLQTRYKFNEKLSFLARHERFYNDKNDKEGIKLAEESGGTIPAYSGYHRDTTLGLSYDFSNNVRIRFEYHWVQGIAKLTPVVLPNPQINSTENWQLWAVQLMYWF